MFVLTIETDNAAFHPEPGPELARILRQLADTIVYDRVRVVFDANGNRVGTYTLDDSEGGDNA